MSYYPNANRAADIALFPVVKKCLCCGEEVSGPTVMYDGFPSGSETLMSMMMHRDCAFAMAQRLICDAWPNRNDSHSMVTGPDA